MDTHAEMNTQFPEETAGGDRYVMKPLNVLQFICPAGLYGAEMWILALARYLDREEVNCSLAVTHESEDQNLAVVDRFEEMGLTAHRIPMKGRFDPLGILKLVQLVRQKKISIIHTHGYKSDILGLIVSKLTGVKILSTPHGFENVKDFKLQMFIRLGCLALRFYDHIAPLSEGLMEDMDRMGLTGKKIQLIRNGVDLYEVASEKDKYVALSGEDTEKRIGYVGQMAHRKNVGDLIKAFDLLFRDHRNVRLTLVGDGPMRKELERIARGLPSASRIEFTGYRGDRLRIMGRFDIFSMTSALEGIPRCMMEAMALGIPVAAYGIPGVDRLIINGKTGLMVPFGDAEGLKNCWEQLLYDEELSCKISRNGREHVLKNYSGMRMAHEYKLLYRSMLAEQR